MKRITFIVSVLLILIGNQNSYSTTYIGTVTDTQGTPLSDVAIFSSEIGTGAYSDSLGNFTIELQYLLPNTSDSLNFSKIGYYTKSINKNELAQYNNNKLIVQLIRKTEALKEVVIQSKRIKTKTIGVHTKSLSLISVAFSYPNSKNNTIGTEIGRKFNLPKHTSTLKAFRYYIDNNNFDTVVFKINIYNEIKGKPHERIIVEDIIQTITSHKTGWIQFDLTSYSITTSESIIVSIELIGKSQNGNFLSLPLIMPCPNVHLYKDGKTNKWTKYQSMVSLMELDIKYMK